VEVLLIVLNYLSAWLVKKSYIKMMRDELYFMEGIMVEVVSVTLGPKIRNVVLEKKCGF